MKAMREARFGTIWKLVAGSRACGLVFPGHRGSIRPIVCLLCIAPRAVSTIGTEVDAPRFGGFPDDERFRRPHLDPAPALHAGRGKRRRRRASQSRETSSGLARRPRPPVGRLALAVAERDPLRPPTSRPPPLRARRTRSDRLARGRVQDGDPAVLLLAHRRR